MARSIYPPRVAVSALLIILSFTSSAAPQPDARRPGPDGAITDVPGVRPGHYAARQGAPCGTTAILFDGSGVLGTDVRGGNPVTPGASLFNPVTTGEQVAAAVLTGGSFFGLADRPGGSDEKAYSARITFGPARRAVRPDEPSDVNPST